MNPRWPLLFVAACLSVALALWAIFLEPAGRAGSLLQTVGSTVAVALAAMVAIAHLRTRLRLLRARETGQTILRKLDQRRVPGGTWPGLRETLHALGRIVRNNRERLEAEVRGRERAEETLRESEERYALAVRGADDGMWEWNLRTGSVYYSPRWKSLLGYSEHELGSSIDEWRERVHPLDAGRVERALQSHLEGETARLDVEHRLRHSDGSYRWVHARGAALRDATGKVQRVVGLNTDISARKQVQEALIDIADGLSTLSGEECFRELTRRFAEALGVREAFVCECRDFPTTRVSMLARWNRGAFDNCVDFDLTGTSCEDVIQTGQPLFVPGNLGARWPLEKTFARESYLGLPCIDSQGRVIGHIACADGQQMRGDLPHIAILKIFALRAAVEIERRLLERGAEVALAASAATPAPWLLH